MTIAKLMLNNYWASTLSRVSFVTFATLGAPQVLQEMGPLAHSALPSLEAAYATDEESALFIYQAIQAIDMARPPDPRRIMDRLQSENAALRIGAAEALWKQYRTPELVLEPIVRFLEHDDGRLNSPQIKTAFELLREIGGSEKSLPIVQKLLETTSNTRVAVEARKVWIALAAERPVPSSPALSFE